MSPHDTTSTEVAVLLAVVKTLVLVIGGLISYFAFKAYRRTRHRALGMLTAGFATVTIGVGLAGVFYELLDVSLAMGIVIESVLVLVGFLVIAYSLYVR